MPQQFRYRGLDGHHDITHEHDLINGADRALNLHFDVSGEFGLVNDANATGVNQVTDGFIATHRMDHAVTRYPRCGVNDAHGFAD